MKLLGWMHRKLRQTSIEPFKEFTIGNSCACLPAQPSLNNQQYYLKPSYGAARSRQPQDECQRTSSEVKTKTEDEVFEEELSIMTSELFNGFLTIGTLGLEPIITEPSTPTFPMPFENITEKETEVTENELKLINDELEKFLEAEAKEVCNESSARSSHVSTITLDGKQTEGMDPKEYGDIVVCPLQGYLFGSSIELPETSIQVEKETTPVGQLSERNEVACEYSKEKCEKGEKKIKGTYSMHFMKKMLKKLCCSSRSSAASADDKTADSVSTKKKLPKVFRMFHKKIHPERSADEKESAESYIYEISKTSNDDCYNNGDLILQDKQNRMFPHKAISKKKITNLNLTRNGLSSSSSTQNREHWIKTDADYSTCREWIRRLSDRFEEISGNTDLVLEL